MKKITILSTVLCLALIASGCNVNKETPANESEVSETSAVTTEEETTEATTKETEVSETTGETYDVLVNYFSTTLSDDYGEYMSVVPHIFINGEELTEINEEVGSYMQENYPLEEVDGQIDGYETRFVCGVKDNTISIVYVAYSLYEDYSTCEVFNYDLTTFAPLDNSEMVKRLCVTDDEVFSKTADIYTTWFSGYDDIDVDKCIEEISYDTIKLFISPEGEPGVAVTVTYGDGSQFSGLKSMRSYELNSCDFIVFPW